MNAPNVRTDPPRRRLVPCPEWHGLTKLQTDVAAAAALELGGCWLRGALDPYRLAAAAGVSPEAARQALGELAVLGLVQQTGVRDGLREWRILPRPGFGFGRPDRQMLGGSDTPADSGVTR